MGAKNTSAAKTNYYSVAYGYLSTTMAELPAGRDEVTEKRLKAAMQKYEKVDLRNAFIRKDGERYQVFFQTISGTVTSVEKVNTERFGYQLVITMVDEDNENSVINIKFYNKYVEDFLNRLISITSNKISLSPYSIPSDFNGRQFFNQGIVIREGGEKIMGQVKTEDLPPVEEVTNPDGSKGFSRVKRIDFLFEKAIKNFKELKPKAATEPSFFDDDEDDGLPF